MEKNRQLITSHYYSKGTVNFCDIIEGTSDPSTTVLFNTLFT